MHAEGIGKINNTTLTICIYYETNYLKTVIYLTSYNMFYENLIIIKSLDDIVPNFSSFINSCRKTKFVYKKNSDLVFMKQGFERLF